MLDDPERSLIASLRRPRVHVRARCEIEHFQHDAALIDVDACMPRRDVPAAQDERVAIRVAKADGAALDDEVSMLAVGKTESHQGEVGCTRRGASIAALSVPP